MDLFLVRHAKTVATAGEPKLSKAGCEQVEQLISNMQRNSLAPSLVLSSPLLRARQTAKMLSDSLGDGSVIVESWLEGGLPTSEVMKELAVYQEFESILVVGHEPYLSALMEDFLRVQAGSIKFKKSSLAWLQGITPPSAGATLKMLLPPS